jgi:hypothetical protein
LGKQEEQIVNELVRKLTQEQEIEASLRPERNLQNFKAAIDRNYVHLKFPNTRGGTELGFPVDKERSDLSGADWEHGTGTLKLVGELTLDYVKVRFHSKVDLASLAGKGYLEVLEDLSGDPS